MNQDAILGRLSTAEQLLSTDLQKELNLTYEQLYAELVSLNALDYITLESKKSSKTILTKEGEQYA